MAKEEKAEQAVAEKPAEGQASKRLKISSMTIEQVEKELKNIEKTMGGFQSRYACHLLSRKKELKGSS
ncbi:MAG: hypothetical protein A3G33_01885 [Omnitrophica bacterium RIFCSPLOWO2_12_FULL_44_17]|uniref:50S ribosomal protein L29 n=1 Tax=Candidatus Danuiimicrobium aquiferis TaxID=1801832 RepID=A0A1G1KU62_9BACT|nr:MAG: hypothetical protein A3B72_03995 [Omnitrophica bacterium RIFCSPHIGHO2_02_FULL_45_28]OGW89087.1 MAG: hypothetical protein A3E74_05560 [Omnitrophica bacterium RIFCSPHIGHO2_12_FULL_44_12]OGW96089.1 MAG: hypothetical protein A3G33_01885 [Omnitrophica bacterium RIFCSPLOWO2_12_FULL_44_17]OGX02399.1 MAG: hypothetical protein A3J12_05660 [Omnitrophica bacterium RIFCSPLOWO2_02_FULL_44_11]